MDNTTVLNVEGMTCANCARSITRVLEEKGMQDVHVSFTSGEVEFTNSGRMEEAIRGIHQLGYKVTDPADRARPAKRDPLEIRFGVALLFTVPLLLHMIPGTGFLRQPVLQLLLCIPVMVLGLGYFGRSALGSLRVLKPNMDVLVSLGSSMAFIYSVAGMVMYAGTDAVHRYLFFETAASIITFVLLGNVIEKRSLRKTVSALEELAALQPDMATRIRHAGTTQETLESVPAAQLRPGDLLQVNTGDRLPADGLITEGSGAIDQSMMTGESIPSEKSEGGEVLAGTVLLSGSVRVQVQKESGQSVLAEIIQLVKKAQASRPRLQRLGDRVSAVFVPVVGGIALLTFMVNLWIADVTLAGALMRSIAVLVIACPCAMGLATPTAVSVGIGRAAREKILVRNGEALEILAGVKTVIFDKTGTLTTGRFRIGKIEPYGITREEAEWILFSIEKHSSHPIARSLVSALEGHAHTSRSLEFESVLEEKGFGIRATGKDGREYLAGSYTMASTYTNEPGHTVYLIVDGKLAATADLADEPRQGAAAMIGWLKQEGINSVLLSGDTAEKCKTMADALGIDHVYSEQLPQQKTQVVESLKRSGTVVMVGDGINDAPSLASADCGVSFGHATGIAVNSAQVILMSDQGIDILVTAIKMSRATVITIKQNLFWAFLYNVLAIPLAAAGFLSPLIASLSMAFSDVVVIGNSVRLKYKRV